jgi:hypothetical protein
MYSFLVDISKKLDWPLREFANTDEKSQIENLFSLKDKLKKNKQSNDSDYQSKLTKQISFFGIASFFNKLNELNSVLSHVYSNKIVLVWSLNEKFKNHNEKQLFPHSYLNETLGFILNIWHQLDHYAEYHNVISKCLNNCKLDNLYSLQQFINTFYSIYKFSILNNKEFIESCSKGDSYWTRLNYISILLLEKNLINVSFES